MTVNSQYEATARFLHQLGWKKEGKAESNQYKAQQIWTRWVKGQSVVIVGSCGALYNQYGSRLPWGGFW